MTEAALTAHLDGVPGLAFALLFGSRSRGGARADSDWDVGIFFDDGMTARERFDVLRNIAADLPNELRVDLVDLNSASALLGHQALKGRKLIVNDLAPTSATSSRPWA